MIGIIGSGKLGVSLGRYFKSGGNCISGIYEIDVKEAATGAQMLGTNQFSSLDKLLISSKVVMVAVPDDQIEGVWEELREGEVDGKTIFHTSGTLSSSVFKGAESYGVKAASLHPMMTFSDRNTEIEKMRGMAIAIEGECEEVEKLVMGMGNNYFKVSAQMKVRYHLGGVYACNLLLPMISRGIENLRMCGLDEGHVKEILMPLIEKTIDNINLKGIKGAVSGPLERGDAGTIEKHLKCQSRDERKLYVEGSKELLRILERRDERIERLLEGEDEKYSCNI